MLHSRWQDLIPIADELVMLATASPAGTAALAELKPAERGVQTRADTWRTAAALTHRVVQRQRLALLGVNPRWGELQCPMGSVLKSSYSTGSVGVAVPREPMAGAIWEQLSSAPTTR